MTRAITLYQPYAEAVACGRKTIETRSWAPPASAIGERLLVQAAARKPQLGPVGGFQGAHLASDGGWMTWDDNRMRCHPPGECAWAGREDPRIHRLPLGVIVASCTLAAAVPMVGQDHIQPRDAGPFLRVYEPESFAQGALWLTEPLNEGHDRVIAGVHDQRPYGDFAPGRWAWLLEDVRPTSDRCPACWGYGQIGGDPTDEYHPACPTCDGEGACPPVPARGRQRIWNWEPS